MKQEILIWKTFDQTVFHKLNQSTTVKEKRNILSDALRLNERDWKNGKEKTEILLDAFTQCYNFAQQHEFSVQSSSGNFYLLFHQVHSSVLKCYLQYLIKFMNFPARRLSKTQCHRPSLHKN